MTDQPIDPATPDDADAPEIAADDAGASAIAERIGRHSESPILAEPVEDNDEEDLDAESV